MSARTRRPSAGFSLLELAVALIVFEVGVLGVVALGVLAAREVARAADLQRAVGAAEVVADSLLRSEASGAGETRVGPHTVRWSRVDATLVVEVGRPDGSDEPLVRIDLPEDP